MCVILNKDVSIEGIRIRVACISLTDENRYSQKFDKANILRILFLIILVTNIAEISVDIVKLLVLPLKEILFKKCPLRKKNSEGYF